MATERIQIIVSSKGTVVVKREIDDIGRAGSKAANGVDFLKSAIAGLVTAATIGRVVRYADTFTNLQNRLRVVNKDTMTLTNSTNELYRIAQDTRTGFEGIATVYARTAQASKTLGLSQERLISFSEQLAKATALSGSTAESANAALIQLSQGLASGTLRGQELNSVLEQLPYVANAIAQGILGPNGTAGALRALAEQGQITPKQIIEAFSNMSDSINADFARMIPTISQGLTTIDNAFIRLAGLLEKNSGLFGLVARGLVFFGNNLEAVLLTLSPFIAALTFLALQVLGSMLISGLSAGFAAMTSFAALIRTTTVFIVSTLIPAIASVTANFIRMSIAMAVNPIVLYTVAITALGVAIAYLVDLLFNGGKAFASFEQAASATIDNIKGKIAEIKKELDAALGGGGQSPTIKFDTAGFSGAAAAAGKTMNKAVADGGKSAGNSMKTGMNKGTEDHRTAIEKANDGWSSQFADKAKGSIEAAASVAAAKFEGTGRNIYDLWNNWGNSFIDSFGNKIGDLLVSFQKAQTDNLKAQAQLAKAQAAAIRQETEYLRMYKQKPGTAPSSGSGSSNQTSSSTSSFGSFANGGSFRVGGSGGTDSQEVRFKASPNERVTIETPAQQNAGNNNQTSSEAKAPIIQNLFDPRAMLDTMDTAEGRGKMINFVRANRDELQAILGVA